MKVDGWVEGEKKGIKCIIAACACIPYGWASTAHVSFSFCIIGSEYSLVIIVQCYTGQKGYMI